MPFELPPLPYDYAALEPYIDEQTLHVHHDKHHQTYVDKANAALAGSEWAEATVEEILRNLDKLPDDRRVAARNHVGGHANHTFYWESMGPARGKEPSGTLASAIEQAFGDLSALEQQLTEASVNHFGSGWGWLVHDGSTLKVISTHDQESPLSSGLTPLLTCDVWEHAYYLKYQNRRPDYVSAWWNVVDWERVAARLGA
ncbi:MAG: superoxide dismutase [Gaiellaceae bacterium]|jgi:Fe-Mn family superoxide dismutase